MLSSSNEIIVLFSLTVCEYSTIYYISCTHSISSKGNNVFIREYTKRTPALCESRFHALGKLGLIKGGFFFSHCEISDMMGLTAILPPNLPHTILSEIRPPTCWAHPSLLTEPRKQTPLSSSPSDSCRKSCSNSKHVSNHKTWCGKLSSLWLGIFFSILTFV